MTTQSSKVIFETFNDGLCGFHSIDDDGNVGTIKEHLRFQNRTVGSQRYYEAMTNKVQIDRLIRVPFRPWLTTEYLVVINGEIYEITQVQLIPDSLPKTNNVSLHHTRQRRIADGTI